MGPTPAFWSLKLLCRACQFAFSIQEPQFENHCSKPCGFCLTSTFPSTPSSQLSWPVPRPSRGPGGPNSPVASTSIQASCLVSQLQE